MSRLLLISENLRNAEALHRLLGGMQFDVVEAGAETWKQAPFCPIAVLDVAKARLRPLMKALRRQGGASKLLVLMPFDVQGLEAQLTAWGADDVLEFPLGRPRLEVTLRNLLRLYRLERAGDAAYGETATASAQTRRPVR